jgi:outer membrane murein-binding lipoprotein Lpp
MSNVGYHSRKVRSSTKAEDKIDELSRAIEELGKSIDALQRDVIDLKRRIPNTSK